MLTLQLHYCPLSIDSTVHSCLRYFINIIDVSRVIGTILSDIRGALCEECPSLTFGPEVLYLAV
jgi:hypothetical protein